MLQSHGVAGAVWPKALIASEQSEA